MATKVTSLRIPVDLDEQIGTLAEYRKEDRTTLLVKMLRFSIAAKAGTCAHQAVADKICVECGWRFVSDQTDY